jgi:hypothetical protein
VTFDVKRAREICDGFRGRFFYDAERGDIGYIAKDCDDKVCDCEVHLNADGDQDCAHSLFDWEHEDHINEPLVQMLNTLPAALDEIERLRVLAKEALNLALVDGKTTAALRRVREIRAEIGGGQ